MKYFHIDTESQHRTRWPKFCVGEEFVVGNKINPIYTNWINSATRVGTGITTEDVNRSFSVMLRELAFENLRAKEYPTLPSRTSCIWLCESEEAAKYWVNRIPHVGKKRIMEIEILEGVPHKTYEEHLTNNPENIKELQVRAHAYWLGQGNDHSEILFEGRFCVTREI